MEFAIKTIDSLCIKITDGSHFSPEYNEQGKYPMYSSKDMLYNSFDNSDVKWISEDNYYKLLKQDCRPLKNDILIIKDGNSYLKRVFKVKKTLDAVILSSIAILRPDCSIIDPDYFTYLLRSDSIRNAMSNYVSGAAIPRIVLKDFKKMKLKMISDVELQQKIANILTCYDEAIENNNKRIKLLEQMAQNLYKEWFVRFRFPGWQNAEFENGIPKGWKVEKLNSILDVKYGKDHSKIEEGKIPILGSGGVMRFGNKVLYSKESVLIPRKGSLNNVMYMNEPFWTVDTMFFTEMKRKNVAKYIYYVLSGLDLSSFNSGAALPSMTTDILYHFKIILPSDNLLLKFDDFVTKCFKQIDVLKTANKNLAKQRDLLLPRLMSGKLEVE